MRAQKKGVEINSQARKKLTGPKNKTELIE